MNGYQGVMLKDIVMTNLADGVKKPGKISVIGVDGYETEIDVDDMLNGITSRYQERRETGHNNRIQHRRSTSGVRREIGRIQREQRIRSNETGC